MSSFSDLTRYAQARRGFSEECDWRDALGEREPLRVFVTSGPLDAPEWMPAGSMAKGRAAGQMIAREALS
jgi:hypothetical protein